MGKSSSPGRQGGPCCSSGWSGLNPCGFGLNLHLYCLFLSASLARYCDQTLPILRSNNDFPPIVNFQHLSTLSIPALPLVHLPPQPHSGSTPSLSTDAIALPAVECVAYPSASLKPRPLPVVEITGLDCILVAL